MNNNKSFKERIMFTVWLLIFIAMVFCFFSWFGCTWGVVTENGEQVTEKFLWSKTEIRVDDIILSPIDKHESCRGGHYVDPYTKKEYCLPENFINIEQLHLYRVEKEND